MKRLRLDHRRIAVAVVSLVVCVAGVVVLSGQDDPLVKSEPLPDVIARTQKEKPSFAKRQQDLLNARYDLSNRPAAGVTMTRGKAVQDGVRVKLPANTTWSQLAAMSPEETKTKNAWPAGFLPLPHPHHEAGGMIFPKLLIDETTKQTGRDLTRFDLERALKSIEDFTEFEQRGAYFDGDHTRAARKGVNPLERGSQVQFMGEFQNILDFPPAPKLNILGRLDPALSTEAERRGESLFFGKAQCATCHPAPYYTDNLMHNLRTERFFTTVTVNGRTAAAEGPIKTFPLRGIKDSPPYLRDDRLLTLDDTVEFFNLVLGLKLLQEEKRDLVMFLRAL